jgi:hypothetical protein
LNSSLTNSNNRITLAHAARLIGISRATSFRWAANGALGELQGTKPIYVSIAAVEAAIGPISKGRIEQTRRARKRHGVRHG